MELSLGSLGGQQDREAAAQTDALGERKFGRRESWFDCFAMKSAATSPGRQARLLQLGARAPGGSYRMLRYRTVPYSLLQSTYLDT